MGALDRLFGKRKTPPPPQEVPQEPTPASAGEREPAADHESLAEGLATSETVPVETEPVTQKPERIRTQAEHELANLENLKAQLEMVEGSLRIEHKGKRTAESARFSAEDAHKKESRAVTKRAVENGGVTEEDRGVLRAREGEVATAKEWVGMYEQSPNIEYEGYKKLKDGVFKAKLESLGVDVENTEIPHYLSGDPVGAALAKRIEEVEKQIREKKLEVPGGKEEMIVEAVQADNLLSERNLENYERGLHMRAGNEGIPLKTVYEDLTRGFSVTRTFPTPVRDGALALIIEHTLEQKKRGGRDTESLERNLSEYRTLHDALARQSEKQYKSQQETLRLKDEVKGIQEGLQSLGFHQTPEETPVVVSEDGNSLHIAKEPWTEGDLTTWVQGVPADTRKEILAKGPKTFGDVLSELNRTVTEREARIRDLGEDTDKLEDLQSKLNAFGRKKMDSDYQVG